MKRGKARELPETVKLRDYFASNASEEDIATYRVYGQINNGGVTREMARYQFADAMLWARQNVETAWK